MTAGTDAQAVDEATPRTRGPRHLQADLRPVVALVATQAVWMWWALSQGWFLQADLSNLADGAKRPITWGYVSQPLGGHFAPINRVVYWIVDRLGRLDYSYTVFFRVGCQVAATLLLYRILVELVGRRPLVLGILLVYGFNPVLLGGAAWFTSGIGLIPAQALAMATVLAFLRYDRERSLRLALLTGVLLALTVLAADQWVVTAPAIVLLAVVHLYQGSLRSRLAELLRQWRAWLLILAPFAAALVGLVSFSESTGVAGLSFGEGYRLLRESWLKTLGPSLAGGPWDWINGNGIYISYTGPADWMVLLGQVTAAVLVLVGVRRLGLRSLAAWIMPVACAAIGVLIIGVGRYSTYGMLLAITPRYLYQAVVWFAIGAALALAPLRRPGESTARTLERAHGRDRLESGLALVAVAVVVMASLVSGARFASQMGRSPVRDFVANLETGIRSRGTAVNLWNTPVPQSVISSIEPSHRISDVLKLLGVTARFDDPSPAPLVVTQDGHLASATYVPAAIATGGTGTCGTFVHGKGTWTIELDHVARPAEWFLRLELYQSQPSDVRVEAVEADGHVVRPITGADVHLGRLEARNLPLPLSAPAAVRVHSGSSGTNLCLARVSVGGPFAVAGQ